MYMPETPTLKVLPPSLGIMLIDDAAGVALRRDAAGFDRRFLHGGRVDDVARVAAALPGCAMLMPSYVHLDAALAVERVAAWTPFDR